MQYLHKTLNSNDYFRHLATLNPNPKAPIGLSEKIVRFLYRASCLFISFHYLKKSQSDSVNLAFQYLKQIKFNDSNRIAFSCSELFLAYAQVSSALSALVLMQNELIRIIPLISGSGNNLPKSMNRMMEKGVESYGFSNEIENLLKDYWEDDGKYIRDLRNINEHYDHLVNHTFFEHKENIGRILIFLPDNPETQSPKGFKYENEKDASQVIFKAMNNINKLVESICELQGISKGDFEPFIITQYVESFDYDKETTVNLMISVEEIRDGKKGLYAREMKYLGKGEKNEPLLSWETIARDCDLE